MKVRLAHHVILALTKLFQVILRAYLAIRTALRAEMRSLEFVALDLKAWMQGKLAHHVRSVNTRVLKVILRAQYVLLGEPALLVVFSLVLANALPTPGESSTARHYACLVLRTIPPPQDLLRLLLV